jgi:hypothetical protein
LNVIATNFGYFGLSYVMLMRLVEISSGASSSIGVIIAFFLSYLFEVLKYSFLKEKKKEKRTVEIQKYEYKKYVIHTCVWIRSDGTLTISLEDERTFDWQTFTDTFALRKTFFFIHRRSNGVSGCFGSLEIFPPSARVFSFSDRDHIDALSLASDGRDARRERSVLLVLCWGEKEEN